MDDIGVVTKNKQNKSGQPFMYRGIDDVMNALNPAMVKNKIFVVPEVLEQIREDRLSNSGNKLIYSVCKIRYTFYAEDGSSVPAVVIGEAFDSGDKATNKAMSIAFKYACFQVFCIPTEEMKDPDSESHELANDTKGKENKSKDSNTKDINKNQADNETSYQCENCGTPFTPFEWKNKQYTAKDGYEIAKKKCNGQSLCNKCKKEAGL
jgi:hypothetical protein